MHTEGPLLIFAGAGTGKTRVITHRIAYLLGQGVNPAHILAVTFTNKAAQEMRTRLDTLAPGRGRSVWMSTFHSFGAHFLRVEAAAAGLAQDFLIYDTSDQKNVIKSCLRELNLDDKKYKPGRIMDIISRSKDELLDADSYGIHALTSGDYFRQAAATIYSLYQKKLKTAGAVDFGDLLMLTVATLRDNKDILEKYQERFRYVLVDEYQDTNHAQYLLTKYLSARHKNICVVGDDDQSIYSWRGADIRNILEFERDYPGCHTVKLEQNYRSTASILDAAWQVVRNNSKRVDKKVWTDNHAGAPVNFVEVADENDEAQWIVDEVARQASAGARAYSDCAVFYRVNAQSRVLEDAFRRSGIPYAVIGTMRFYERHEIKDILAYLRLLHNPNDNVSFRRVINAPRRGIGKTSMDALDHLAIERSVSLWDALEHLGACAISSGAKKAFVSFRELINELRRRRDSMSTREIAALVIEKTGYVRELEAEDTPESKSRIENIYELFTAIEEFEARSPDKTLSGYLTQVALVSDVDDLAGEEERNKVTLMTLHLAKGLEFKTVFIVGLEEGLFPIGEAAFDPEELEEERRLMYVGMTRAKEDLYLCCAAQRRVFGKTQWNMPSRFMEEARSIANVKLHTLRRNVAAANMAGESESGTFPAPLPERRQENTPFPIGSRVRHQQFGDGKVIDKSGAGDDLKLVVVFDSGQWKKLVVKYANLEKI